MLVLAGAVLFAVGFAAGYVARGGARPEPSQEPSVRAGSSSVAPEEDARASRRAQDAGTPSAAAPGSRADTGAADGTSNPRGTEVAVVGSSETARAAGSGGAASEPTRLGEPPPPLDGGAPPTGRLAPSAIRDVVRSHRDQLGFCFAWQLHSHPELRGRLTMDFTIGEDGTVTRAEVAEDELGDETVLTCFRNVTRRMQFPAPEGGEVRVRYPFVLAPTEERAP